MSKIIYRDTEVMIAGHSIILGNMPAKLASHQEDLMSRLSKEKTKSKLESFGFFDSTPSLNTYYPDVTAEDLAPKDEDFIYPVFRALSEVLVRPYYPVSFQKNGILKKSMNKLKGQSIYANHEAVVGNELGTVSDVFWQDAYKTSDGVEVPAGMNVRLKVDGKSHPKIARAVMMDPPAIHSVSVTVEFGWEKSHPNLDDDTFYAKLGTMYEGSMVSRLVSEIYNYHEISFVSHGADAFAQKVDDKGQIVNPKYASSTYRFSNNDTKELPKASYYSYKDLGNLESLADTTIPDTIISTNSKESLTTNKTPMHTQLILLMASFGIVWDETKAEALATELKDKVLKLKTDLDTANLKLKALPEDFDPSTITKLKASAKIADDVLAANRDEAIRLHNVITVNKPDAAMVKLLSEATSHEVMNALLGQLKLQADVMFPKEGRQTSEEQENLADKKNGTDTEKPVEYKKLSNEEAREKLIKDSQIKSKINIH